MKNKNHKCKEDINGYCYFCGKNMLKNTIKEKLEIFISQMIAFEEMTPQENKAEKRPEMVISEIKSLLKTLAQENILRLEGGMKTVSIIVNKEDRINHEGYNFAKQEEIDFQKKFLGELK